MKLASDWKDYLDALDGPAGEDLSDFTRIRHKFVFSLHAPMTRVYIFV